MRKQILPLGNTIKIYQAAKLASNNIGKVVFVSGIPGSGKSLGVRYYELKNNHCIIIIITNTTSRKDFLRELCRKLVGLTKTKYSIKGKTTNRLHKDVSNLLLHFSNPVLLILDNARKIDHRLIEVVTDLLDSNDEKLACLMVITPKYWNRMLLFAVNREEAYAELLSRKSQLINLESSFCKNEIDLLVDSDHYQQNCDPGLDFIIINYKMHTYSQFFNYRKPIAIESMK